MTFDEYYIIHALYVKLTLYFDTSQKHVLNMLQGFTNIPIQYNITQSFTTKSQYSQM